MRCLVPRLEAASDDSGTVTFVGAAGDGAMVRWTELFEDAQGVAAAMQARGVGPGDHIAILGPTNRDVVTAIEATWLAGATVVCLPLPLRLGSLEEFVAQTRTRIRNAEAALVLVDPALAAFVTSGAGDPPTVSLDELRGHARHWERPPDDPDLIGILQFTSGSTDDPKGVMLPHRCLVENIDAIVEAAGIGPEDVGVSWLPLYHDMGLIGMLMTPMLTGFDLALAAPQDFLAVPGDWMRWISEFGATMTCGPNFSYALAARAMRRASGLDLSRWRLALNGAEPIDPSAVEAFCQAGAAHGLSEKSPFCVYGMAEATLAISFPEPSTGMAVDVVDRHTLEHERRAVPANGSAARRLAMLGRPLRGFEIRVCDPADGTMLDDREVGELELRGGSITPGYFRRPDLTAATFHEGWLRTGDLGYCVDGEVVVCGRIKDVINIGGRNVYPEEIERAAASVEGVRTGNVVAFGIEGRRGKEAIVVVAETRVDAPDQLRDEVVDRVCDVVGIPPLEVRFVAPGSLPKTSSGKLQRSLCRTRYLTESVGAYADR
ncbi:MAG: fatty-acid--CoA ligase [Actinobacteria bacterium]|nr:MAG: fatty-acid--CoA ligase [Actinomycetota bacterium]